MDDTMPQGRIVLKSICQSRKLAELKDDGARLLYTWLLPNVDINGCFSGDAAVVNGQVFTRLRKSHQTVRKYLQKLAEVDLIILYESNGDAFLYIPDFVEKQPSLNPDREAKSTIPPPTPEQLQSKSGLTPLKVKESKGKESKIIYISVFDTARKEFYGTKRGNQTEFDNFRKKHNDWREVLPLLLSAIKNQIAFRAKLKARSEFVPPPKNFKTWINNRCWEETFKEPSPPKRRQPQDYRNKRRAEWSDWIKQAPINKLPTKDKDPYDIFWLVKELRPEVLTEKI